MKNRLCRQLFLLLLIKIISVKVIINNQDVTIFNGARVRDAVLAYSKESYKLLRASKLTVRDRHGNITEADGSLSEGQIIFLQLNTNK